MNSPLIKTYKLNTGKLTGQVRFVLLSDLHSRIYGEGNRSLLDLVRDMRPDIILCAGDMLVGKPYHSYHTAADFLCALPKIAPVFFSNGNHETQYRTFARSRYGNYLLAIREAGVPAEVSNTAGTFVCNQLMYGLLYFISHEFPAIRGGFLHLPYLTEQTVSHPDDPGLSRDDLTKGITAAVRAIIADRSAH